MGILSAVTNLQTRGNNNNIIKIKFKNERTNELVFASEHPVPCNNLVPNTLLMTLSVTSDCLTRVLEIFFKSS